MEAFLAKYAVWFGLLVLVLEYIIGKTKVVDPNSTIDLVIQTIIKVIKFFLPKKEEIVEIKE